LKNLPDFRAVIFDLDGTLIDSLGVWAEVDRKCLERHGVPPTPDYTLAVSSMSFRESAEYTIRRYGFPETPEELMAEWMRMVEDEYAHHITLKPFVREYLSFLKRKGAKLAVATASPPRLYGPVLKNNGVYGCFDAFACVEEVERGKGFPDVFLLAASRLGVQPCDCLVFEDTLPGIRGAKAAGMTAIGVYDSSSQADESQIRAEADGCCMSFAEFLSDT
jgi:HAD superfamily hydrolase (TIGR01509 family)